MPSIPPGIKKFFSIAIFAGIVFFGAKTCEVESAECELVFKITNPEKHGVSDYEIRLFEEGSSEIIGQYRKQIHRGSGDAPGHWPLQVASGDYRIEGEIRFGTDKRVDFDRPVTLENGDVIVVHLDRYLSE